MVVVPAGWHDNHSTTTCALLEPGVVLDDTLGQVHACGGNCCKAAILTRLLGKMPTWAPWHGDCLFLRELACSATMR